MTFQLAVPRASDKEIIDALSQLKDFAAGAQFHFVTLHGTSVAQNEISDFVEKSDRPTYLLQSAGVNWNFQQSGNHGSASVVYTRLGPTSPSPYVDRLDFNKNGVSVFSLHDELRITQLMTEKLRASFYSSEGSDTPLAMQNRIFEGYHSAITQMNESIGKTVADFHSFIKETAAANKNERDEQTAEHAKRLQALQGSFEKSQAELEKRKSELDRRESDLDNRSSTHARRDIRKELLNTVRQRAELFKLSDDTNKKRIPIHAGFVASLVAFAVLFSVNAFFGSLTLTESDSAHVLVLKTFRNLLPVTGFFATLFIYIRWMNSWATQHAQYELSQMQFELDVNRASWALESALEWKQSEGSPMPDALVSGITRALFESGDQRGDDNTALDSLASAVLGSASQVKLKMGDTELELGPKGLKSLGKAAPKS